MKKIILTTGVIMMLLSSAFAFAGGKLETAGGIEARKTVLLYPKGQDSCEGTGGSPVACNGLKGPEILRDGKFLTNVSDSARIDLYFPEKPNGQMVVVCPGGGYGELTILHE